MVYLVDWIVQLVLLAKDDLGKWGDAILIALGIVTIAGILTTIFILLS